MSRLESAGVLLDPAGDQPQPVCLCPGVYYSLDGGLVARANMADISMSAAKPETEIPSPAPAAADTPPPIDRNRYSVVEEGRLRWNATDVRDVVYHKSLNVLLGFARSGRVVVLDVGSGTLLHDTSFHTNTRPGTTAHDGEVLHHLTFLRRLTDCVCWILLDLIQNCGSVAPARHCIHKSVFYLLVISLQK